MVNLLKNKNKINIKMTVSVLLLILCIFVIPNKINASLDVDSLTWGSEETYSDEYGTFTYAPDSTNTYAWINKCAPKGSTLVFPSLINGLKVVLLEHQDAISDGEALIGSNITTITLPENLVKIGYQAFYDCTGLKGSLIIPNTVNYIDNAAFYGCSGLTGVLEIPENMQTVKAYAFMNCTGLDMVLLPNISPVKVDNGAGPTFGDTPVYTYTAALAKEYNEYGNWNVENNGQGVKGILNIDTTLEEVEKNTLFVDNVTVTDTSKFNLRTTYRNIKTGTAQTTIDTSVEGTYEATYILQLYNETTNIYEDIEISTGYASVNREIVIKGLEIDDTKALTTVWKIPSGDITITLPLSGTNMEMLVDWGDGSEIETVTTNYKTHPYNFAEDTPVTIKVQYVAGTEIDWGYNAESAVTSDSKFYTYSQYLTKLTNWGDIPAKEYGFSNCINLTEVSGDVGANTFTNVTNMEYMFNNCSSLADLDVSNFNTSNVKYMGFMFNNCSSLTELNVSNLDTSNVLSMNLMFGSCSSLTELNVSNFNTSNVNHMIYMFGYCSSLTELNVSNFNTSKVTRMNGMFNNCSSLTELNVSNFNTSNVTTMEGMFMGCSSLKTLDLSNFKTSNVTTMTTMFYQCSALTSLNVSSFNTSNVTTMQSMFNGCNKLTSLDVSSFNTTNVTSMQSMFDGCSSLTTLDLSNFNTAKVTTMLWMFQSCSKLTSVNVSSFNTEKVTTMGAMFAGCIKLTKLDLSNFYTPSLVTMDYMFSQCYSLAELDISNFNTSKIKNMQNLFYATSLTELNLSNFDTSNVINMQRMFCDCTKLESIELSSFNTSNVTNMVMMFQHCYKLTSVNLSSFNTSNVTNMGGMFQHCSLLTSLDLSNFNTSKVTSTENMFYNCSALTGLDLGNWYTPALVNMTRMFYGCSAMTSLDVSKFNTSQITDMQELFYNCSALTSLDLSSFNTSNVTTMSYMFYKCGAMTSLNVSSFNTEKVTTMYSMFNRCSALQSLDLSNFKTPALTDMYAMFNRCTALESLNVSNFDTDQVTTMYCMFVNCTSLKSLDLSSWYTPALTDMYEMFYGCSAMTSLDVSKFDTTNIKDFYALFYGCSALTSLDLSSFNTSNVANMKGMFYNCSSLTSLNISSFITANVTDMSYMFKNCNELTTLDLSSFNTSKVTVMTEMFTGDSKLKEVTLGANFAFVGTDGYLPVPTETAVANANGKWYNVETEEEYTPAEVAALPSGEARTFIAGVSEAYTITLDPNGGTVPAPDLPESYTQLTYIESTGTQYINTGFIPKNTTKVVMDLQMIETTYSDPWQPLFGSRTSTSSSDRFIVWYAQNYTSMGNMHGNYPSSLVAYPMSSDLRNRVVITRDKNNLYCNDALVASATDSTFTGSYPIYLFALNTAGNADYRKPPFKLYSCQIYDDGTLVRNFIPCKDSNGTIGLYDTVNNEFYTNAGTGTFKEGENYSESDTGLSYTSLSYTKTSPTIIIPNPTRTGYAFTGWTEKISTNNWYTGFINMNTGSLEDYYSGYPNSVYSELIYLKANTTYSIIGNSLGGIRWRVYNLDGSYKGNLSQTATYTTTSDCYVRILLFEGCTEENRNNAYITQSTLLTDVTIPTGSTGNREYIANWKVNAKPLTTVWQIPSGEIEITLPLSGTNMEVLVDWGDGTVETVTENYKTHPYNFTEDTEVTIKVQYVAGTELDWGYQGASEITNDSPFYTYSQYITKLTNWGDIPAKEYGFAYCTNLTEVSGDATENTFDNVKSMSYMFYRCTSLETIDLSDFNTSNVTNMHDMFGHCYKLTTLDLNIFDTGKVTNMSCMFGVCTSLTTLYINKWNTENVTNMGQMFDNCIALTKLEIGNWNVEKVENVYAMFFQCYELKELDISKWNTQSLTNMQQAFSYTINLEAIDISKWNTQNVTNMNQTFAHCRKLKNVDISNFNTSNVTNMNGTFYKCNALKSILVSNEFIINEDTTVTDIFTGSNNLTKIINVSKIPSGDQFVNASSQLGNITFYVPNESVDAYKDAWSIADSKIKPILESTDGSNIMIIKGETYDMGTVTVAGFDGIDESDLYEPYGYKLTISGDVDTTKAGRYKLKYILTKEK